MSVGPNHLQSFALASNFVKMGPDETSALIAAANKVQRSLGLCTAPSGQPSKNANRKFFAETDASNIKMAQQLLWLWESLSGLFGTDLASARAWLREENIDLEARPVDLIESSSNGLETVCNYLSSYQHRS